MLEADTVRTLNDENLIRLASPDSRRRGCLGDGVRPMKSARRTANHSGVVARPRYQAPRRADHIRAFSPSHQNTAQRKPRRHGLRLELLTLIAGGIAPDVIHVTQATSPV